MATECAARRGRKGQLALLPACLRRCTRNVSTFCRGEALGASLATFKSTSALGGRMPLGLAYRVLSLADGNVEYLLGKLDGITRTFDHATSMPQAAP